MIQLLPHTQETKNLSKGSKLWLVLKNFLVEVKQGSMVFDSSFTIVSINIAPDDMARACGTDNEDGRFTDTAEAHLVPNKKVARNNLIWTLS